MIIKSFDFEYAMEQIGKVVTCFLVLGMGLSAVTVAVSAALNGF